MHPDWDLTGTILNCVSGGIIVFGPDGEALLANDAVAEMFGLSKGQPGDFKSLMDRIIPDDESRANALVMFEAGFRGERSSPAEFTATRGDKTAIFVDILFSPVFDRGGDIVAVVAAFFDASERKHLEQEHREIELEYLNASRAASLGELASGIAHSINNPLAGILGYLDLLADDYPEDVRIKKCIEQCKRIGGLTQNLAYHGRNALMKGPVRTDLNELIRETLVLLSSSKLYNVLEIETELSTNPVVIKANPGDITLILINLLRNARDALYGRSDGRIVIGTSVVGNDVKISISDNGVGIAEVDRNRIFDPFFTTKPRGPAPDLSPSGCGLGLSTSRYLVHRNNGRIEFTSEVGKGSTFNLIFPLAVS